MNKEEAIRAMRDGKKVTHTYFSPDEWITMQGNKILSEDGYKHDFYEFWSFRTATWFLTGWSYLLKNL